MRLVIASAAMLGRRLLGAARRRDAVHAPRAGGWFTALARRLRGGACAAALVVACGPRTPTQMVIRIDSDLRPGTELLAVRVNARREGAATPVIDQSFALTSSSRFVLPGDVVITAADPNDARRLLVQVTAVAPDDAAGFTIEKSVSFVPGHIQILAVLLPARCRDAANRDCPAGTTCGPTGCETTMPPTHDANADGGAAMCPAAQTLCGGRCTDVASDPNNCGGCGTVCPTGAGCSMGACACAPGLTACGARCVDLTSDEGNCGGCGRACVGGMRCAGGGCCSVREAYCGGRCIDVRSDPANCGTCGARCSGASVCTEGSCRPPNDECRNALPVALGPGATTLTGSLSQSSASLGSCTANGDVFYTFELAQPEVVYADTFGSAGPTAVGFASACDGTAQCSAPACGTDQGQIWRVLPAGTHVLVVASGAAMPGFAYAVRLQHVPVAALTVDPVPAGAFALSGTTLGAANTPGSCGAGPDRAYAWSSCPASAGGALTASTCGGAGFETLLALRNGDGSGSCDDTRCGSQSSLSAAVPAGAGLHVLFVDGATAAAAGAFTVTGVRP